MTSRLNLYLSFKDGTRAAMEFYKTVFGGEATYSTFGEAAWPRTPPTRTR